MAARILFTVLLSTTSVRAATMVMTQYSGTTCSGTPTVGPTTNTTFAEASGEPCVYHGFEPGTGLDSFGNHHCDMASGKYKLRYHSGTVSCGGSISNAWVTDKEYAADGTCVAHANGTSSTYKCTLSPPAPPVSPPPPPPKSPPELPGTPDPTNDLTGVIAGAAGGAALIIGVGIACYFRSKAKGKLEPTVTA